MNDCLLKAAVHCADDGTDTKKENTSMEKAGALLDAARRYLDGRGYGR